MNLTLQHPFIPSRAHVFLLVLALVTKGLNNFSHPYFLRIDTASKGQKKKEKKQEEEEDEEEKEVRI